MWLGWSDTAAEQARAIVEAVQRQGHSELLGEAMARVAERRGRRIAKVAAARRLLSFVFYALRDGELRCLKSPR